MEVVFDKMKLAGEAGSLLKIEEEIKDAVAMAWKQWMEVPKPEQQLLFPGLSDPRLKQQEFRFDLKGITDKTFMDRAEEEIVNALRHYAEKASNGRAYRKRLFAEDAERGFALIDLCRQFFDVVLMNPPFGKGSTLSDNFLRKTYPDNWKDLYASFFERAISLVDAGFVGAITSSQFLYTKQLNHLREILVQRGALTHFVKLGLGVLDGAAVDTGLSILNLAERANDDLLYLDTSSVAAEQRGACLSQKLNDTSELALYRLRISRTSQRLLSHFIHPQLSFLFGEGRVGWSQTLAVLQQAITPLMMNVSFASDGKYLLIRSAPVGRCLIRGGNTSHFLRRLHFFLIG